jgi:hypothetical protein
LLSTVQGSFLDYEGSESWDQVGIIRYRNRRDFLEFAAAVAGKGGGQDKWLSMDKTHVFPTSQKIRLGSLHLTLALILMLICLMINLL